MLKCNSKIRRFVVIEVMNKKLRLKHTQRKNIISQIHSALINLHCSNTAVLKNLLIFLLLQKKKI